MTDRQFSESLTPGDYAYDNSAHRHKGRIRYAWAARNINTHILYEGHAISQDSARIIAMEYALK